MVYFMENPKEKWMIWGYPYFQICLEIVKFFFGGDDKWIIYMT